MLTLYRSITSEEHCKYKLAVLGQGASDLAISEPVLLEQGGCP